MAKHYITKHHELIYRAVVAFFKDQIKLSESALWPTKEDSAVYRYNAREYVVLRAAPGEPKALAVYRIRPSNSHLRRVFNYPPSLDLEPEKAGALYRKL